MEGWCVSENWVSQMSKISMAVTIENRNMSPSTLQGVPHPCWKQGYVGD